LSPRLNPLVKLNELASQYLSNGAGNLTSQLQHLLTPYPLVPRHESNIGLFITIIIIIIIIIISKIITNYNRLCEKGGLCLTGLKGYKVCGRDYANTEEFFQSEFTRKPVNVLSVLLLE